MRKAPIGELADIKGAGLACADLAAPDARRLTGGTIYVDGASYIAD